ncbi:4Fe-4S binding domain-containing protein [Ferrimonas sediminum]|uniref:4Fe-4S binding domain-containing protein n=1 Tax=Ferrimonas sediminum TaxID=718193 RepID=A0A1G8XIX4_9GAMM|nr:4Fe-4S binding protein [Ferrimonas sediminum]SDJ90491.1 4Fe-4S binding domain-containing protein [Ferrimonas sediminum]
MSIFESLILLTGFTVALGIVVSLSRSLGVISAAVTAGLGLLMAHDILLVLASFCFLLTVTAGRWLLPSRLPSRTMDRFDQLRQLTQNGFAIAMVIVAVQYALYAMQMNAGSLWMTRPSVVDVYLPITAGVSLRAWIEQGIIDHQHPAALVLFLSLLGSALITKRAFCSWVCSMGFFSEVLYERLNPYWKRDHQVPAWLDSGLKMTKYGLLIWLLCLVMELPSSGLGDYLNSERHLMADLSMWQRFTNPSLIGLLLLAAVLTLSTIKRNAFCRYFCPYGALMGLLSMLSPFKIRRNPALCLRECNDKDCRKCQQACPSNIPVHQLETVTIDDCHACHRCAQACPKKGALTLSLPGHRWPLKPSMILLILLFFITVIPLFSYLGGYWQSESSEQLRQAILPKLDQLSVLPVAE